MCVLSGLKCGKIWCSSTEGLDSSNVARVHVENLGEDLNKKAIKVVEHSHIWSAILLIPEKLML